MTPTEKALTRPHMMTCAPYTATISQFQCAFNWRKGLLYCKDCKTGAKLRREYPFLVKQAAARLAKVQIGADHQQALREIMGGQMEYDRDKREHGKPREGLRVG